jgi:hypothetical protein
MAEVVIPACKVKYRTAQHDIRKVVGKDISSTFPTEIAGR